MYYILLVCIIFIVIYLVYNKNEHFNNNIKINKTYVINLDSRKDRLQSIDKDLKKIKLEYERFPACNGKQIDMYSNDISKYFDKNNKLSPGQIGCSLSHIKIWEKAIKNNNKYTLVLEDDAIIPSNFNTILKNSIESLPKNWDLLSFNCSWCTAKKYNNKLYKLKSNICTLSYLISTKGIKKIFKLLKNKKFNKPIDVYLNNNFYNNNNCFITQKSYIYNNGKFNSDINIGNGGSGIHKIKLIN